MANAKFYCFKIIFLIIFIALSHEVLAANINAATCSQLDVQSAINSSSDGDTIIIPAGNCTWSTPVALSATSKSLTLKGSSSDTTIINVGVKYPLKITGAQGFSFAVSGLQFTENTGNTIDGIIRVGGTSKGWRIHHLKFNTVGGPLRLIMVSGYTYGVVDHVVAAGTTPSEFITVDGDNWASWQRAQAWGDANAVFIEDNNISWTGHWEGRPVLDGESGGRAVFRHNTVTNAQVGGHGFDTGFYASMLSAEVYNNFFIIQDAMPTWSVLAQSRGGTSLWHNNNWSVGGAVWVNRFGPNLQTYRVGDKSGRNSWFNCDGTQRKFCSNIDKNWNLLDYTRVRDCVADTDCPNGFTCKWKFCSNSLMNLCASDSDCFGGGTCSAYEDGPGDDGYPCRMQIGFSTQMLPGPVYGWNNLYYKTPGSGTGGNVGGCSQASPCAASVSSDGSSVVQENRDFFNAPKPGYAPYIYPHPLITDCSKNPITCDQEGATDTIPPTLSIASPTAGAAVNGTVTITATASDNAGINRVEFYLDNVLIDKVFAQSYTLLWDTDAYSNGIHALHAMIVDTSGNSANSTKINLTVNNSAPVVNSITMSSISMDTASFSWITSRPASTTLEYGTTTSYGNIVQPDTSLRTVHVLTIQNLTPDTVYHFRVLATSASGLMEPLADNIFTTIKAPSYAQPASSGTASSVGTAPLAPQFTVPLDSATLIMDTRHNESASVSVPAGLIAGTITIRTPVNGSVKIDVKSVTSVNVPSPAGSVYKYMRIDTNATNLSSAEITFDVPIEWMKKNVDNGSVLRLLRYHPESGWQPMNVHSTGGNMTHMSFRATLPGFFIFAIVAQSPTQIEHTAQQNIFAENPVAIEPLTSGRSMYPVSMQYFIISGVMVIVAILLALYYRSRRYN